MNARKVFINHSFISNISDPFLVWMRFSSKSSIEIGGLNNKNPLNNQEKGCYPNMTKTSACMGRWGGLEKTLA